MYLVDDEGHQYELKNLEVLDCSKSGDGILFFSVKTALRKEHIAYLEKELREKTKMHCIVLDHMLDKVFALEAPIKRMRGRNRETE